MHGQGWSFLLSLGGREHSLVSSCPCKANRVLSACKLFASPLGEAGECGSVEGLGRHGSEAAAKSGLLTPRISSHVAWTVCCLQRVSCISVTVRSQSWRDSEVRGIQLCVVQLMDSILAKKKQAQEMGSVGINHPLLRTAPLSVRAVPHRTVTFSCTRGQVPPSQAATLRQLGLASSHGAVLWLCETWSVLAFQH